MVVVLLLQPLIWDWRDQLQSTKNIRTPLLCFSPTKRQRHLPILDISRDLLTSTRLRSPEIAPEKSKKINDQFVSFPICFSLHGWLQSASRHALWHSDVLRVYRVTPLYSIAPETEDSPYRTTSRVSSHVDKSRNPLARGRKNQHKAYYSVKVVFKNSSNLLMMSLLFWYLTTVISTAQKNQFIRLLFSAEYIDL